MDERIEKHLQRWRSIMTTAGHTNRDLAEEAIASIYKSVDKKLASIIWLESPYQTAIVPVLVENIVESKEWFDLAGKSKSVGTAGGADWQQWWSKEWESLDAAVVKDLFDRIGNHPDYSGIDPVVKERARAVLRNSMMHILRDRGRAATRNPLDSLRSMRRNDSKLLGAPPDMTFARKLLYLHMKVEEIAGLQLTIMGSIPASVGVMLGIWDRRLVRQLLQMFNPMFAEQVSAPKPSVHSSEIIRRAKEIKDNCRDLEELAARLWRWFGTLPAPQRFVMPEIQPQFQPADGALDRTRQAVEMSAATWREMREQRRLRPQNPANNGLFGWTPYIGWFLPFALGCRFIRDDFFGELQEEIDPWAYLAHSCAGALFRPDLCFACEKPLEMHMDDAARVHSESGPAMVWADGLKIYSWHGIVVEPRLIENPESITIDEIRQERNAEIRRVLIGRFGESRFMTESDAKILDDDPSCGVLMRLELPGDEPLVMVRVKNSTPEPDGTYKHYFLRVPPNMSTARQAVAWTFGMNEREYNPGVES